MTIKELEIEIKTLSTGNWSEKEKNEIDEILKSIENNDPINDLRNKISNVSHCKMLITICSRF